MKKPSRISFPGRLTTLAALCAALSVPVAASAAGQLVISQLYGAGGNAGSVYSNDYVEIFNPGNAPVTANGWTLQYASATGSSWTSKVSLPSFTIDPGKYVLVQLAGGSSTPQSLPAPVLVASTSINMAGASGKIALVNDNVTLTGTNPANASIVDFVGFGTAGFYEGSSAAPAASSTLSLFRANGGCTDNNQNGADFATGAPAPRNADTPANSCGPVGPVDQPIATSCANLSINQGANGSVVLTATDPDSIVNAAAFVGTPVTGISLANFVASSANGGSASVTLQASAQLATGSYPVEIRFSNNTAQSKSCTVTVSAAGMAKIPAIQGATATSPFNNSVVSTEGVVTHKVSNGYFLQDIAGDGDPATSDAIFVFTSPAGVNVGDLVQIKGTVTEFKPTGATRTYTELKDITASKVVSAGNAIAPTNVVFDADLDLARHEAMLLSFGNTLTVNQTSYLGDRGELTLSVGRRETATNRFRPGTPEALALAAANAKNQLILDDSLFATPVNIPYLGADGTVRAGDTVVGSSRVDLQACKLEYSIVSPK